MKQRRRKRSRRTRSEGRSRNGTRECLDRSGPFGLIFSLNFLSVNALVSKQSYQPKTAFIRGYRAGVTMLIALVLSRALFCWFLVPMRILVHDMWDVYAVHE